jgi:hypothetical protein
MFHAATHLQQLPMSHSTSAKQLKWKRIFFSVQNNLRSAAAAFASVFSVGKSATPKVPLP